MMKQKDLLDKYYRGETSPDEENELKALIFESETDSAEKNMFGYFQNEKSVPDDLEALIFETITKKQYKSKKLKLRLFNAISAAAVVLIFLSIYLNNQSEKNAKMEENFLVIEKALFQVSESIQPDEQKEMLVLWVDDDVEIIIH